MLDRTNFASWQQRIRLYCQGKDNGVNILKSINEGPYKLGTFRKTLAESTEGTPQFGPERPHVFSDLNSNERDQYNADIWATNILLQGLPKYIYTLVNHYTDAKDIWDNVKMLLKGSELTKEDRESQLYDDFEHFRQHKEDSNNDYYVSEENGDLPVPDLRTMEELCQTSLNGRGGPIALIATQATKFGLKNDMIQQVQNSCQFQCVSSDDANKNLNKSLHVTPSIKVNGVTDDALRLYLFPHSLTHHATSWFDRLPRNSINTFEQMAKMFLGEYFRPSMVTKLKNEITNFRQRPDESLFEAWERYKLSIDRFPNHNMRPEECYDIIENITTYHNDWDSSAQRSESSSSITSSFDPKIIALKAEMAEINKNLMRVLQPPLAKPRTYMMLEPIKVVTHTNLKMNTASSLGSRTLPSNTITNPMEDLKGITTRSGTTYQGPMIPTTSSSLPQVVKRKTEVTKDTMPPTNNGSTKYVQPLVVQVETLILNFEPVVAPIIEPVVDPVNTLKPNQKPLIPHPPTIKSFLTNKDKLYELARTSLNEHCSAVLLKKLPEKLGDPGKLLIPCDFPGMDECLALADLEGSINLMPLSVWNKLSLPQLTPTLMTLELANRSISRPIGVAEDVFVKVRKFYFLADFVVVDFDAEPRVPLILGRSFLKTRRALIDVFEGELTLPKNDKSSINEPPEVELKDLPLHLEYTFLEGDDKFPVIIAKDLSVEEKAALIKVLKSHKQAIAWKLSDIKGINPDFYTHKILMEDDFELAVQLQRRVNPKIHDVIKKEVLKLLDVGLIYPISDSPWVSLVHCVPKKGGFTVFENEENELFPTRLVTGWRVCIDYRKLNEATRKDHFPLPFMDQMLKRLAANEYYCFLDGFSGYFQIPIDPKDLEKTTFMCPYGTFAYHCMPFGLCNAPGTFQRCSPRATQNKIFPTDTLCKQNNDRCSSSLHHNRKRITSRGVCFREIPAISCLIQKHSIYGPFGIDYVFNKQDAKPRLLRRVLLLQEFDITIRDKKGAENLVADHISRLENPHQNVPDPKEINKAFPLKTLNMVSFRGNSSTPWFADFAKYHAGNFIVKGMSSQQKNKFFKDVKHFVQNLCGSSHQEPKRCLTMDSIGPQSTVMPITWSNLVTLVNVSERFHNVMKCLKIPSKFARFLTFETLISWGRSRLHEGTSIYSFGTPRAIISDLGTYFYNDQFTKVMLKYGVTHRLATAYHPQTSGQVEVSNRGLKGILERTVGENRASWSDTLDNALWAFRTSFKTPIGCTPYKFVYGNAFHLPIELEHKAYWALKHANFDIHTTRDHIKVQLNELNKLRNQAYENSLIYKEKTKRLHDSKIKDRVFNVGNRVLLFNSRLKIFSGKLKARWSGQFIITHVFPYCTVKLSQTDGPNFKVNGHRLKHYFGEDIPKMVIPDLQTFPKDQ
nr:reverse transcriptase domain-containing protein [Tanacetum cinerariifolium]